MIQSLAPWTCAGLHTVSMIALLGIMGGTEMEPDVQNRILYIQENSVLWRLSWIVWMASSVSLVAFYAWWSTRVTIATAILFPSFVVWVFWMGWKWKPAG